jgi:hypothetical protein
MRCDYAIHDLIGMASGPPDRQSRRVEGHRHLWLWPVRFGQSRAVPRPSAPTGPEAGPPTGPLATACLDASPRLWPTPFSSPLLAVHGRSHPHGERGPRACADARTQHVGNQSPEAERRSGSRQGPSSGPGPGPTLAIGPLARPRSSSHCRSPCRGSAICPCLVA